MPLPPPRQTDIGEDFVGSPNINMKEYTLNQTLISIAQYSQLTYTGLSPDEILAFYDSRVLPVLLAKMTHLRRWHIGAATVLVFRVKVLATKTFKHALLGIHVNHQVHGGCH